jgi:hypothetical protein
MMKHEELVHFLGSIGVPPEQSTAMAEQLEKRATQLSEKRNQSYDEALTHLINLLKQGWAAKQKNVP